MRDWGGCAVTKDATRKSRMDKVALCTKDVQGESKMRCWSENSGILSTAHVLFVKLTSLRKASELNTTTLKMDHMTPTFILPTRHDTTKYIPTIIM